MVLAVPNEENKLFRDRVKGIKTGVPWGPIKWGSEIHLTNFQPDTIRGTLRLKGYSVENFGVDDVYLARTLRIRLVLLMQKALSAVSGWHFSIAMFAVGRKSV